MEGPGAEAAAAGSRLRCMRCGTSVRLERVGGGRMECCDRPLRPTADAGGGARTEAAADLGRVRCAGCGNEARLEHDGGGTLCCCNKEMQSLG